MHAWYDGECFLFLRLEVLSQDKGRNIQSDCLGVGRENLLTCTFPSSWLLSNIDVKCSDLMLILL